jgi:hypothetical protein
VFGADGSVSGIITFRGAAAAQIIIFVHLFWAAVAAALAWRCLLAAILFTLIYKFTF